MKKLTDELSFRHGLTVKNRIVQPPMLTNSGKEDGFVTEDTIRYYNARSQSSGMVIVEYCYVSFAGGPSRTWTDDRSQLGIHTDAHIPGLRKIANVLKTWQFASFSRDRHKSSIWMSLRSNAISSPLLTSPTLLATQCINAVNPRK